ncbi:hypothetical protein AB3X96_37930 [Paraburkholderia sp. BR13439]|uniref:hypothetical protein n=1 Tax=unclassified Paraburkholderia TaxID=2615204 RepID=UPI0034CD1B0B
MDLEQKARESGMLIVPDGRIGCEEYKSVYGSLDALQRFANSVGEEAANRLRLYDVGARSPDLT